MEISNISNICLKVQNEQEVENGPAQPGVVKWFAVQFEARRSIRGAWKSV